MPKPATKRLIGAALVSIGAMLLIVALLSPWYFYDSKWAGGPLGISGTQNATYYLGLPSSNGTIHYTCSRSGGVTGCPSQTSYYNAGKNNTGLVAAICFGVLLAGCAFAIVAGVLGLVFRRNATWAFPVLTFAVLALVLAMAAVVIFAGALPGAFSTDGPVVNCGTDLPGPWSSFFGSGTETGLCGGLAGFSYTWGPLIGWYLSLGAVAALLAGVVVMLANRKDPSPPTVSPTPISRNAPPQASESTAPPGPK
jgi:hypothetical protein